MSELTLDKINVDDTVIIKKVNTKGDMRRRFLDIGLIEGTIVKCVLKSPSSTTLAYLIRGAVIGIRKEDASSIIVDRR